jgi:hypothetical protein
LRIVLGAKSGVSQAIFQEIEYNNIVFLLACMFLHIFRQGLHIMKSVAFFVFPWIF